MLVLNVAGTDENAHGTTSLPKVASDREVLPHLWRPLRLFGGFCLQKAFCLTQLKQEGRLYVFLNLCFGTYDPYLLFLPQ